jgi:hypothetical protein
VKCALVAIGFLLASCGSTSSKRDPSGALGGGGAGGSGGSGGSTRGGGGSGGSGGNTESDMCYVDFPCYVMNKYYRCSDDGRHYQIYQEVSCSSVCGNRPCSGGGCRLSETLEQCPEGYACRPSQDIGSSDPCSERVDAGGVGPDASRDTGASMACTDDHLLGLPAAGRPCTKDSDCAIVYGSRCCGPIPAFGEARTQAAAYQTCLHLPQGACDGLSCPSSQAYITDTGRLTPEAAWESLDDWISVTCLNGLCTTDLVLPLDAGTDQRSSD